MKRFTPASRAFRARPTEPLWLISMVRPGSFSPIGSLESSARCTTASKPRRSSTVILPLVAGEDRRMGAAVVEEPAAAVEAGVEPDHLVAGLDQLRAHDRADIAVGPGQEYAHLFPYSLTRRPRDGRRGRSQTFHGALPLSHISCSTCLSRSVSMFCQKPLWW